MRETLISVLIPTYNAEKYIVRLLDKLYSQKLSHFQSLEIIVVDSSSTDKTLSIIKEMYPEVIIEVIKNNNFDHGGTRNMLAGLANGDYLLYMTQDAIPYDAFLICNLYKELDEKTLISYARQIPKEDAGILEVFARGFNYPDKKIYKNKESIREIGIKTFFNSNVCSMYKRTCFEQFEGFPEKIILNEDMIMASKVILSGYNVCYSNEAKVYHSHNYTYKQQFKRYFDIGMAFEETDYLLEYASNEKEGLRMIIEQLKFLIAKKYVLVIPKALIEVLVKFIGYKIGKKSEFLSPRLVRKFSAYMK
ncbi:glycosyltransferase family 2 protein [Guptibacillus algicola]|uniref:glycosyltransferase family 2 protein n=1 Tax=Guptibacillus algicola TaxID=225844 RepID=UPI001CD52A4F|nr:glycosyltransferase [Alkalihalobacillus algicola]MCA0987057.1 glycosyltransferase [Alkalihalobacillus algicola]